MDRILVDENNVQNLSSNFHGSIVQSSSKEEQHSFIEVFNTKSNKVDLKAQNDRNNENKRIKKLYMFLKQQLNKYDPYYDQRLNTLILSLDLSNNVSLKIGQFCCALGNIEQFLDLFATMTRDAKFRISLESLEVLMNYCIPLVDINPKDNSFKFTENQLVTYEILRASMIRYTKIVSTVPRLVINAMKKLIQISTSDHPTLSIGAYRALNSFLKASVRYFDTPELFEHLLDMSQQLSEDHPLRPLFIHGMKSQMTSQFDPLRYLQTLIIERKFQSLYDFSLLESLLQENKFASFPFSMMRFIIQTFFFGNEYSQTAFLIISENLHYFNTCHRLRRWTNNFIKNAFKWYCFVVKNNKYNNRRKCVLLALKQFEQLDIPSTKQTIVKCASTLTYVMNSTVLLKLWKKDCYDESFIKELMNYHPDISRLKHTLLWPPEQPKHTTKKPKDPEEELTYNRSKRREHFSDDDDFSDIIGGFSEKIEVNQEVPSEISANDQILELEPTQLSNSNESGKPRMKTPMKIIIAIFVFTIIFHILASCFAGIRYPFTMFCK